MRTYLPPKTLLLQGDIRVESELGVGTVFKVYIPGRIHPQTKNANNANTTFRIAQQEADSLLQSLSTEEKAGHHPQEAPVDRKTILIVEDHRDMQLFVESILAEKYKVIKADNGAEGLEKAGTHVIDLIICDVMMPQIDGFHFCEKIKSDITTSHVPVLLLTAKALEEDCMEGFEKGADAYVTKPFNPDFLLVRIENFLQQREQLKIAFNRDFILTPQKIMLPSPDEELLRNIVDMIKNYLKLALRNLAKNRLFSLIKITGLTIGITAALLIGVYLQHELSFDKVHEKSERITRVTMEYGTRDGDREASENTGNKVAPTFKLDFPEIEEAVRGIRYEMVVKAGEQLFEESEIFFAESTIKNRFWYCPLMDRSSKRSI